jgi:transcriptional regulator with XRE-family HTH domain
MANRYRNQRERVTPPHISLGDLRAACGLTLEQVCARFTEATGESLTRGGLSGIENGHRGVSQQTVDGLEVAYGLKPGSITTTYRPRARSSAA